MAADEGHSDERPGSSPATQDEHSRLIPPIPPRAASGNGSHAIIFRCFFLSICMEIGNILVTVPLNQILEGIICRQMVSDHADGVDLGCKDPTVQRELSFIRGWQLTFDVIPGLLTAMLYGLAAKRYGRQFILALSILGGALAAAFVIFVCSFTAFFSPRFVWLSSAFTFVGGGVPVFNAMIFALLSDAVHESKRSTTFFYMNATPIGSQVFGGVLAFLLMRVSAWMCIYCGASFSTLATLTAFLFPASIPSGKAISEEGEEVMDHGEVQTLRGHLQQVQDAFLWFTRENFLTISLLSTLLVTTLGRSAPDILLQYITKRYGWTWSDASLLVSIHWFITLILLAIILPSITQFLIQGKGLPSQRTDLLLARVSIIASSIGAFVIGLSSNIPFLTVGLGLFTLSYAYPMLARSLLASVVDSSHTDVMYTTISIFEALGSIIAGPLLAASFRQGLGWGTEWLGLPFLLAGALFGSAIVVLSYVQLASSFVSNV